ncbi:MAG: phosphoglycerate mutase [Gemmatimonadetes bacterium]|nr:phosphoglycerate mutase [Gemmatimonadota bacterium]
MDPATRPTTILSSPYVRAMQTSDAVRAEGALLDVSLRADERLREKEFGVLNKLTRAGIARYYPEQAEQRAALGKFYHRPPGGESWCDVILRLRSLLDTISLHHSGPDARVLLVAHQVIVLCLRYLLEDLDEDRILAIDAAADVANCGVTEYRLSATGEERLCLATYNSVAPLVNEGTPVTTKRDSPAPT